MVIVKWQGLILTVFATIIFSSLLFFLPLITCAMEQGVFQPPSLEGYRLDETKRLDKDRVKDEIRETSLEIYKNPAGQGIGRYTTNGKTWAWAVRSAQDVNDNIKNYVIRDSKGDGTFDERYSFAGEDFYLPDWVKKAGNKR